MHKEDKLLCEGPRGHSVGRNPEDIEVFELEEAGHLPKPMLKIIREKCLDCCVGQVGEVRNCVSTSCPLFPYRMGTNPLRSSRREK